MTAEELVLDLRGEAEHQSEVRIGAPWLLRKAADEIERLTAALDLVRVELTLSSPAVTGTGRTARALAITREALKEAARG